MRSDIVFDALQTKNRFVLCHEAFKAIRLLHQNNTRIEDTTNDALQRLAGTQSREIVMPPEKMAGDQVVIETQAVATPSLISPMPIRANL